MKLHLGFYLYNIYIYTHTHTHTIYIYIYICVCVSVQFLAKVFIPLIFFTLLNCFKLLIFFTSICTPYNIMVKQKEKAGF